MPSFSRRSLAHLETCDERLQAICHAVIPFYDFSVLCGHRQSGAQKKLFDQGKSQLRWPLSRHNEVPAQAVDVAPYPIDWHDLGRFYYLAGRFLQAAFWEGITLRWGGQWDLETPWNAAASDLMGAGLAHQWIDDIGQQDNTLPVLALRWLEGQPADWARSKEAKPTPGFFFDGPHFELATARKAG